MTVLANPVLIAVVVMLALCLLKVNVMISLMLAAIVGGLTAGLSLVETTSALIEGMAGKNNVVLGYILLGTMAVGIETSTKPAITAQG